MGFLLEASIAYFQIASKTYKKSLLLFVAAQHLICYST